MQLLFLPLSDKPEEKKATTDNLMSPQNVPSEMLVRTIGRNVSSI